MLLQIVEETSVDGMTGMLAAAVVSLALAIGWVGRLFARVAFGPKYDGKGGAWKQLTNAVEGQTAKINKIMSRQEEQGELLKRLVTQTPETKEAK